jgi:hypothetical protein
MKQDTDENYIRPIFSAEYKMKFILMLSTSV